MKTVLILCFLALVLAINLISFQAPNKAFARVRSKHRV